jgi:GTP-binding protein
VKFIDEAIIALQSGSGGRGCVSFCREKYIPRGGPDGGDGGKGGDVRLRVDPGLNTLHAFRFQRQFKAPNGGPGQGQNKSGKGGADLVIAVPPGTLVRDAQTDELICDLIQPGQDVVIARGGRGGQGNARFKTAAHRTPRFAQPGEPGQLLNVKLELKLLADVGIIGLPNAGKSTLLTALTAARPRIDSYPFTTLNPVLGVVRLGNGRCFVVADIPGLIHGAHKGAGLGIRFLKHIERTRVLIHLIDAAALDPADPLAGYAAVNGELAAYNPALAAKPQIVVLNKMDLEPAQTLADAFEKALDRPAPAMRICAAAGNGLAALIQKLARLLDDQTDSP